MIPVLLGQDMPEPKATENPPVVKEEVETSAEQEARLAKKFKEYERKQNEKTAPQELKYQQVMANAKILSTEFDIDTNRRNLQLQSLVKKMQQDPTHKTATDFAHKPTPARKPTIGHSTVTSNPGPKAPPTSQHSRTATDHPTGQWTKLLQLLHTKLHKLIVLQKMLQKKMYNTTLINLYQNSQNKLNKHRIMNLSLPKAM